MSTILDFENAPNLNRKIHEIIKTRMGHNALLKPSNS